MFFAHVFFFFFKLCYLYLYLNPSIVLNCHILFSTSCISALQRPPTPLFQSSTAGAFCKIPDIHPSWRIYSYHDSKELTCEKEQLPAFALHFLFQPGCCRFHVLRGVPLPILPPKYGKLFIFRVFRIQSIFQQKL